MHWMLQLTWASTRINRPNLLAASTREDTHRLRRRSDCKREARPLSIYAVPVLIRIKTNGLWAGCALDERVRGRVDILETVDEGGTKGGREESERIREGAKTSAEEHGAPEEAQQTHAACCEEGSSRDRYGGSKGAKGGDGPLCRRIRSNTSARNHQRKFFQARWPKTERLRTYGGRR